MSLILGDFFSFSPRFSPFSGNSDNLAAIKNGLLLPVNTLIYSLLACLAAIAAIIFEKKFHVRSVVTMVLKASIYPSMGARTFSSF